jgi:hypothetical protein
VRIYVWRSNLVEWIYPSFNTATPKPICLCYVRQPLLGGVTELSREMSLACFSKVVSWYPFKGSISLDI